MKTLALIACIGSMILAAGCGDSTSDDAAEQAAAAAKATQQQVSKLENQIQQQAAALRQQKRRASRQARRAARQAASTVKKQVVVDSAEASEPSGPPDVVGLTLTTAEQLLQQAGYQVDADNTDTMFGIMDTDNYTVCTQDDARGTIVPVLAQKYGC